MDKLFSIIVPTRKRLYGLRLLLNSFAKTTAHIENLEVILVIDRDDRETQNFSFDKFPLTRIIVEPGSTMGALNMAGYRASKGRYVMLLNDDVVVQTKGWDRKVLKAFETHKDEIVLVHVNDMCFGQELCIFPFVSRKYCEAAGGICPEAYNRYRIDDHIHHVFDLIAALGHIRVIYMADVIFEHTNFTFTGSNGDRSYYLNDKIYPVDTEIYVDLLPERKKLALKLMDQMEPSGDLSPLREKLLDQITDEEPPPISNLPRVTIGVVTADSRSWYAFTCINLLKKFTTNFDLIVLDNNGSPDFNHAHEMNKIMYLCETEYLVIMDDDVFVEAGWLAGMLRAMGPKVGLVTPLHKDRNGNFSYAGVEMHDDFSGAHGHILTVPDRPSKVRTICSAIMLIDMTKCNHLKMDEVYRKYFLDIDFGLQVWEDGSEVVCSPYTTVTHLAGATLTQGSEAANVVHERDRQHFIKSWIDTGRYRQLETAHRWADLESRATSAASAKETTSPEQR